ncbi:Ff.00g064940.m01.CDS01 [Fusarium sp. VM40]|nr:Ff.00g064940.m01.CDS01 [Fusarium sp. VM40]
MTQKSLAQLFNHDRYQKFTGTNNNQTMAMQIRETLSDSCTALIAEPTISCRLH